MNKTLRNEDGRIAGIEYSIDEDGFIDWRSMIKDEHLYPNASFFERFGKPVPKKVDGLKDHELLIKLGGIKEIAKIRGFKSVKQEINYVNRDYVTAKCSITWLPNEECPTEVIYEDVANASAENCSGFAVKFLETIAANRAFVRAVRNFLCIHIVGDDEIDKSEPSETTEAVGHMKPHDILKTAFAAQNSGEGSWDSFKDFLRKCWEANSYRCAGAKDWGQFSDIPPTEVRKILAVIKK